MTEYKIAKEKEEKVKGSYSFFFFPLKADYDALISYLIKSNNWTEKRECFEDIYYMMNYAKQINSPADDRMRCFSFSDVHEINIVTFKNKIATELSYIDSNEILPYNPDDTASLSEIKLFVFNTGIAFICFNIRYNSMTVDQIIEFVYLFRSLRNQSYCTPDEKNVDAVISEIIPQTNVPYELCFSNNSVIKRQAFVFSVVDFNNQTNSEIVEKNIDKYRFRLAHGYKNSFNYIDPATAAASPRLNNDDFIGQYELLYNVSSDSYWGGSQDGVVCLITNAHIFQHTHLHNDYLFMFLLLLHQRFRSIELVYRLSTAKTDNADILQIYDDTAGLKTFFSFRIVSDDRVIQSIYNRMYNIFELDPLINDLEDANDRLTQMENKKREEEQTKSNQAAKKMDSILTTISILTIASVLIDLTDYLELFSYFKGIGKWISFGTSLAALIVTLIIVWKYRKKK